MVEMLERLHYNTYEICTTVIDLFEITESSSKLFHAEKQSTKLNVSHRFGRPGQGHMARSRVASQGRGLSWPEPVPAATAAAS